MLDGAALCELPSGTGVQVVYADRCQASPGRLETAGVEFKQIPHQVTTR